MKHCFLYSTAVLLGICLLVACKKEIIVDPNDLVDPRDNIRYSTVVLNDQRWMAENLQYNLSGTYYNGDNPFSEYGRLYTYAQALQACPPGWHLPTEQDWYRLERYLQVGAAELSSLGYRGQNAGIGLKSTSGWLLNNGSNSLHFNAYPAGSYDSQGQSFFGLGHEANFWTATASGTDRAWYRGLTKNFNGIYRETKDQQDGLSCRCVKDE